MEMMFTCTNAPCPDKLGGEKRLQQREVERRQMMTYGGMVGVRSGGGTKIQNMVGNK